MDHETLITYKSINQVVLALLAVKKAIQGHTMLYKAIHGHSTRPHKGNHYQEHVLFHCEYILFISELLLGPLSFARGQKSSVFWPLETFLSFEKMHFQQGFLETLLALFRKSQIHR